MLIHASDNHAVKLHTIMHSFSLSCTCNTGRVRLFIYFWTDTTILKLHPLTRDYTLSSMMSLTIMRLGLHAWVLDFVRKTIQNKTKPAGLSCTSCSKVTSLWLVSYRCLWDTANAINGANIQLYCWTESILALGTISRLLGTIRNFSDKSKIHAHATLYVLCFTLCFSMCVGQLPIILNITRDQYIYYYNILKGTMVLSQRWFLCIIPLL